MILDPHMHYVDQFFLTSVSSEGFRSTCTSKFILIIALFVGIPLTPTFGDLLPGFTEIRIQIKTVASGESPGFRFNIIPIQNGMKEPRLVFMIDNYRSGTFVTLTIGDLTEGGTYTFSATAENNFGESGVANSRSIVIEGLSFVYPFFINLVYLLSRISNSFCWATTNARTRFSFSSLSLSLLFL